MKSNISQYLAAIGRKGGLAKSAAKTAAVRANARKGGRPRKIILQNLNPHETRPPHRPRRAPHHL